MNLSKGWALLGAGCALLLASHGASAAWTQQAHLVAVVQVVTTTFVFVELEVPHGITNPDCDDDTAFVLINNHEQRKEVMAVLLMAQAAKIPVFIRSDGCYAISGYSYNVLHAVMTDSSTP